MNKKYFLLTVLVITSLSIQTFADSSKEDSTITKAIKMASEGKTLQEISDLTGMATEEIEPIIKFHGK